MIPYLISLLVYRTNDTPGSHFSGLPFPKLVYLATS